MLDDYAALTSSDHAPIVEPRLLQWHKITDPWSTVPSQTAGVDVRVLLPPAPEFEELCAKLKAADVPYRQVRYWLEAETISTVGEHGDLVALRSFAELSRITSPLDRSTVHASGWAAVAARDAFEMIWDAHAEPFETNWEGVAAADVVHPSWLPFLPHKELNPAQAQAAPVLFADRGHVLVTAPTGAGKTVIGMLAVLKAILDEGRKAAWLVPQRSLTEELDQSLAAWRGLGLRVERLSGDHAIDIQKASEADLWVSTTEKFEAICRASSLRAALSEVGCLVVDEIHLLGEPGRGPLLEALLARVRGKGSPVRLLGLSATAANADEIASWLGAHSVHVTWRPSRLTWQVPLIPAGKDLRTQQLARTRMVIEITKMISDEEGSVLVFCGSKRNVRATALALAAARGARTRGLDPDDLSGLRQVCAEMGIGIHYKDWEYKSEAERGFRDRKLDVLVATTTVAAGVNLPARAVIVRDTQIGLNALSIATIQQMFGRAGRVGAGETEGWAYLLTHENERATWQAGLAAGYTVVSHLADSLADHLLAEIAQDRIHTMRDAEEWWTSTLAYHQGKHELSSVRSAVEFLIDHDYLLPVTHADNITVLTATELGKLTTRLMVSVAVGAELRSTLNRVATPASAWSAESLLGKTVAILVPDLADAPVHEKVRPLVRRLLRAHGDLRRVETGPLPRGLAANTAYDPGDLARVAFALVANNPGLFTRARRTIAGIPAMILHPILEEAPRYFAWLGAQGYLGTVHPWIAVTANDLGRRLRWRRLVTPRGSGRLLWACEEMATRLHADTIVPDLFQAARQHDVSNPDWPIGRPPQRSVLDESDYVDLLRDRATHTTFVEHAETVNVTCPRGATVMLWTEGDYAVTQEAEPALFRYPDISAEAASQDLRGASVFTWRGDYQSSGWLSVYNTIRQNASSGP